MIVLVTHIWLWWVNEDWQKIKPTDPQDRLIIATALTQAGKLISADTKFVLYEELSDALIT